MRKNNCELIRRELDELMPGEACSTAATEHMRECVDCRQFQEQQTKLRQIVGSLGTVEAPADFDFRLRARLANEASSVSSAYWSFARRGLAVAAMVLVFATGAVVVRNVMNEPARNDEVAQEPQTYKPAATPEQTPVAVATNSPEPAVVDANDEQPPVVRKIRRAPAEYKKKTMSAVDFSNVRADVIGGAEPVGVSGAFPIDTSLESFKVSLNDGRGNAKTISVPTISFGSERVVQSRNHFAPKRDW